MPRCRFQCTYFFFLFVRQLENMIFLTSNNVIQQKKKNSNNVESEIFSDLKLKCK